MRTIHYLYSLGLLLLLAGCPEYPNKPDSTLRISNESSVTIVHMLDYGEPNDTLLTSLSFALTPLNTADREIDSSSTKEIMDSFIQIFEDLPGEEMHIYLFSPDTIALVPWDTIVSDYNILARYDMSLQDLEDANWTVTYP